MTSQITFLRSAATLAFTTAFIMSSVGLAVASTNGQPQTEKSSAVSTHYRNLFHEIGISQEQINAHIAQTYTQLFHGDSHSQAVYFPSGQNSDGALAYIEDIANQDVRTEGMSYGMMISVQLDHKQEFDALWNWANTYMKITDPRNPSVGYFAWSMHTDGTPNSYGPAPDGEEYFVMSLYFAAHRWGNGKGIYDYKAQADHLLSLMRHHPNLSGEAPLRIHPNDPVTLTSHGHYTARSGPMMNPKKDMVYFVPGMVDGDFTDPSYHLPAFYELWSRWGPAEDHAFWAQAAAASRIFFVRAANATTGLSPDYADFDGRPNETRFNPASATFSSDSFRTASNWSVDQEWWGQNSQATALSDRLLTFFAKEGVHTFKSHYTLEGKPLTQSRSSGLVATTAVAVLASALPPDRTRPFVEEFWNTPIPSGHYRYYDGLLYLLSLLHASGQFRMW